jgi:hypothetical protein
MARRLKCERNWRANYRLQKIRVKKRAKVTTKKAQSGDRSRSRSGALGFLQEAQMKNIK